MNTYFRRTNNFESEIKRPYIFDKNDLEELYFKINNSNDFEFIMKVKASNREEFMYKVREYIKNTCE